MKLAPIRLKLIKPSQKRDFDIYVLEETKPVLLLSKNTPLDRKNPILKYNSNFIAYIPTEQLKGYRNYICENIDNILKDPMMSQKNKMYAIYVSMIDNLEDLVNSRNLKLAVDVSNSVSKFIANTINDDKAMSIFFSFIKSDVHNLAVHMFNVGVYATMLTKKMFTDLSQQKLEEISKGFFLHDIGMLKIDPQILLKKGKYSQEEYEQIKKHPIYGVEIIKNELKIRSPIIEKIILEHHERKDGSGYPYGKSEVNTFAKICSLCDIFDAITSKREYKEEGPKTTFEALKDNKDFFVSEFGRDIYENFVKCFRVKQ
ncbi:HD-GYP domain-containing protein [Hippea sp. KM1]|uniref:HD-GYP domain-containing protein n=1 Tax=Hippea sp. KM1 TaxID=944481 RepID=UPI00046C9058|nr:HD domain-containing phosphohydrolase [Hippea sp. KM1]